MFSKDVLQNERQEGKRRFKCDICGFTDATPDIVRAHLAEMNKMTGDTELTEIIQEIKIEGSRQIDPQCCRQQRKPKRLRQRGFVK